MAIVQKPKADVVSLFRRRPVGEDEPEVRVGLPPTSDAATSGGRAKAGADLSGKPKVLFVIGPGGTGKTAEVRWLGWRMAEAGREALLAALDPQNRSLATWFDGVEMPPNSDGTQTARWLRELLGFLMQQQSSAVLDFGGGDTALAKLIDLAPSIAGTMEAAGVIPVALYMVAPRQDDLASLESLEAAGFQPKATAIILNEGRVDSTMARDEAFARVLRHSAFQAAIGRGAIPIWMPRLEPEVMQEIEGKRLTFGQARDGIVPDGRTFAPIGGFERSMVGRWLDRMEQEHEPIRSWLP
jgi:hypothetical protein